MVAAARPAPAAADPRPGARRRTVRAVPEAVDSGDVGARSSAGPRGDHPKRALGRHLAAFLRALHMPAPADAPVDAMRNAHPKDRADGIAYLLDAVDADTIGADLAGIRAVWEDAAAAPGWEGPPVWVHGDLHPANVVVTDGTLSGVVDFGELFAGDPASDLAAAWVLLPSGAAARFFTAYRVADAATVRRARGLAVLKSLFLMLMGQNGDRGLPGGKPAWGPAGRAALDRVLADPHDEGLEPVNARSVD